MRALALMGAAVVVFGCSRAASAPAPNPGRAEPEPVARGSFPGGFEPRAPAAPLPPLTRDRTPSKLVSGPRPSITAETFDVSSLELVRLPPVPRWVDAPSSLPAGGAGSELDIRRVEDAAFVVLKDRDFGVISVGPVRASLWQSHTGAEVLCNARTTTLLPLHWETVTNPGDGTLTFEQGVGWFDQRTCRAAITGRAKAIARPIVSDVVYAFRSTCADCPAETLHVIAPPLKTEGDSDRRFQRMGFGSHRRGFHSVRAAVRSGFPSSGARTPDFHHARLPLRSGFAGRFAGATDAEGLNIWQGLLGKGERENLAIGVEVSRTVAESAPSALVFTGKAL